MCPLPVFYIRAVCSEVSLNHARGTRFFANYVTFNTVNKLLLDEPAFVHCPNCCHYF